MTAHPTYTWDHVHIRTPDVEGMAQWFADTLGAEIVRKPAMIILELGGGNCRGQSTAGDALPGPRTHRTGGEGY